MISFIGKKAKKTVYALTLVYFASYITRKNFSVMLVKIGNDMGVGKTDLAVVVTALTVSYGLGQIISGIVGDRIKASSMLTFGLALASLSNIAVFFCPTVSYMAVVWCINGFAQSMLWPPIVRIMSTYLNDIEYGYAAVRVSWGSSLATITLYTAVPLLLYVMSWRSVMLVCAAVGMLAMIVWAISSPKLLVKEASVNIKNTSLPTPKEKSNLPVPRFVYFPIVLIMLGIILQGVLRDGVENWMPSYLSETFGIPEEKAIISTVVQAVFSMLSFYVFDLVHRRLVKNEVLCSALIFTLGAICSGALYLVNVTFSSVPLSLLLMAMVIGCMHGINLMLISVVPKRMAKSGRVATWSGILNACTYAGAALSTYGFAALADAEGWSFTILMWSLIAFLGAVVCAFAFLPWKRFRREYSDT